MPAIREICSVCGARFEVTFRYQMEERKDGFAFFCSQQCLARSHHNDGDDARETVTCHGCAKRFPVTLASQVFYTAGQRRYACSMTCRNQLLREASGVRLGQLANETSGAAGESSAPAPSMAAASMPATAAGRSARTTGVQHRTFPSRLPRRIAVFNHKGGTGKTTTSVNLAAGLADRGKRVLLVDTDSQGNVAVSLGTECERSLYHVLVMGLRVADATQTVRPGLDLLPSNETLAAAELYLAGRQKRDRILSQRMDAAANRYDYVVVDCSPSLSLMNQNALVFADSVLIPVACDYLSLVGVRQVIRTVKHVNTLLRHPLQIWGVLPTFFDVRAKICSEALQTLRNHFGPRCLPPIRATIRLKEAPAEAKSIFEYAPGTHGSEDYQYLVDRVLGQPEQCQRGVVGPAVKDARVPTQTSA